MALLDDIQPPSPLVPQCQEDVQRLLTSLRHLGAASELQTWSDELGNAYDMALGGIIAMSLHLRVYSLSLQKADDTAA